MEETEREELFERMNKYERSRIINLAEKHCAQMMDLIHRYWSTYHSHQARPGFWLPFNNWLAIIVLDPLLFRTLDFATLRPKNQKAAVINLIHNRTLGI